MARASCEGLVQKYPGLSSSLILGPGAPSQLVFPRRWSDLCWRPPQGERALIQQVTVPRAHGQATGARLSASSRPHCPAQAR